MPFRLPVLSAEEREALEKKSFCGVVTQMLNLLFGTRLTAWEVECCIGRNPVGLKLLKQRIVLCEQWHNPANTFDWTVKALSRLLGKEEEPEHGSFPEVGIRMAVLAAVLTRPEVFDAVKKLDISWTSGNFDGIMAAWYLREMGFPIGTIVCTCNENQSVWELLHHGQLRSGLVAVRTNTPDADVLLPVGLERLIYAAGGAAEVERYLEAVRRGGMYCPEERVLQNLRRGMSVSVVSSHRVTDTIPSVYGTNSYVLSPYGALAYAGLLDHRSKTGENCHGLVPVDKSPLLDQTMTANALGIPAEELANLIF